MEFYTGDTVTDNTNGKNLWVRDNKKDWNLNIGGYLTDGDIINYLNNGQLTWVRRGNGFKISDKAIMAPSANSISDIWTRYEDNVWRVGQTTFGFLTDKDITRFINNGTVERIFTL